MTDNLNETILVCHETLFFIELSHCIIIYNYNVATDFNFHTCYKFIEISLIIR